MILPTFYVIGKTYLYSQLPKEDTDTYTVSQYGLEILGQHAIHINFHENDVDVWFIYHNQGAEGNFKCVYNL